MRRHITRYIDHVRSRPEHERVQHAVVWASIFTGLIFVIWLFFFFAHLSQPNVVLVPADAPTNESAQDTVDRILEDSQQFTTEPLDTRAQDTPPATEDTAADLHNLLPPVH